MRWRGRNEMMEAGKRKSVGGMVEANGTVVVQVERT